MSALFVDEDGMNVACPYCRAPLTEAQEAARLAAWRGTASAPLPCDVCGRDLTNDAAVCVEPGDRRTASCVHCAGELRAEALYCHHCRQWQRAPFTR